MKTLLAHYLPHLTPKVVLQACLVGIAIGAVISCFYTWVPF